MSEELDDETITVFLEAVRAEYRKARKKHAPMNSGHEGYAVLLEEVEELWDDVKADRVHEPNAMKECVQIAAMALAFAAEVCGRQR